MESTKDPFAVLCDKLEAPHPLLQRIAVSSIFQRFTASNAMMQSAAGKEALTRCITSKSVCIVDQSVRELCSMAKSGAISLGQALQILQTSLDSVADSPVLHVLIGGIGFLCRLSIAKPDKAFSVHPLLKALQSRDDVHMEILQQVRLILLQTGGTEQQDCALQFVRPLLAHVFLGTSQTSTFARQLHSSVCAVATSCPPLGPPLLEILLDYARSHTLRSPQDSEFLSLTLQELVDVLEVLIDILGLSAMAGFAKLVLDLLFEFWHESRTHRLPSVPFVSLVRRIVLSLEGLELDAYFAFLAYFLATSELEQEQLLILDLVQSSLESKHPTQSQLLWIFPTLHMLGSPSGPLKKQAFWFLNKVYNALNDGRQSYIQSRGSDNLQFGDRLYRLLHTLWSKDKHETWVSARNAASDAPNMNAVEKWLTDIRHFLFEAEAKAETGFPVFLAMLATALTFHPRTEVSVMAVNVLAALGQSHSIWGVSLLPIFMFCLRFHLQHQDANTDMVIALLNALPEICGHPTALPLCMHLLQPMVDYDANLVLQSTSIRIIYKIWRNGNRAYPYLQRALLPNNFLQANTGSDLLLSKAVSLRDLCRDDSDAGVDLILSVQACIESKSSVVQALGLQGLSFLCSDDAIDFYTAWKVIAKFFSPLPKDSIVAESFCLLLKHGALDAAAYSDDAQTVVQILWEYACAGQQVANVSSKTRSSAIESLCAYEVEILKQAIIFESKHLDLLLEVSGTVSEGQAERLVVKFLDYEHRTRERATNDKVLVTKLGRLLEAVPRTFSGSSAFHNDDYTCACLFFVRSESISSAMSKKAAQQALKGDAETFKKLFFHAADSIHVSGDLLLALISLYSWCWFMPQWLKLVVQLQDAEKATDHIVKTCMTASEANPRVAENASLALAAFTQMFSQTGFQSSNIIAKYFESRILYYGHESAQWSAAISLGVMTTNLHPTDWQIKAEAVSSLIKCAMNTESSYIVGSAAMGLGFACQSLLLSKLNNKEHVLLSNILHSTLQLLRQRCPQSTEAIDMLARDDLFAESSPTSKPVEADDGDNFWAIVGLVWALGCSVAALGRIGKVNLAKDITEIVISWVPDSIGEENAMPLAVGACLVAPTCIEAADRLELLETDTLESLLNRYERLIRQIIDLPLSRRTSQARLINLFRASCIGSGGLLAGVLQTGAHPLELQTVHSLLDALQRGYTQIETPQYCFGAMLGLANALGAGIMSLRVHNPAPSTVEIGSKITSPLLLSNRNEGLIRTMVQQLVTIAHSGQDNRLKSYAKLSLGIMHATWLQLSKGTVAAKTDTASTTHWSYQPVSLSSLPEHSTLRLLCEWLTSIGLTQVGVPCSAAISVFRCLGEAPRLPMLDWGGLIRRLMQHKSWFSEASSGWRHNDVRRECIIFSLRHADRVPPLASVLDEMYEISRFATLDITLQKLQLELLGDLRKVFTLSRLKKLLEDAIQVLRRIQAANDDYTRDCRICCWNGLGKFWEMDTGSNDQLLVHIETCMRDLIALTPARFWDHNDKEDTQADKIEWSIALNCLKHARREWLLEVFEMNDNLEKAAFGRFQLAGRRVIPLSALKSVRSKLLDQKLTGQWTLLKELALALNNSSMDEKVEWLLDAIDMAYISKFPSTAVYFVALLSSMWSPHAYLLPTDKSVLNDLPHTLQTLTHQKKWQQHAGAIASKIFALAEKIGKCLAPSSDDTVEDIEELTSLFGVLNRTATSIREYATPAMVIRLLDLQYENKFKPTQITKHLIP